MKTADTISTYKIQQGMVIYNAKSDEIVALTPELAEEQQKYEDCKRQKKINSRPRQKLNFVSPKKEFYKKVL